jgi:hypothetical protein
MDSPDSEQITLSPFGRSAGLLTERWYNTMTALTIPCKALRRSPKSDEDGAAMPTWDVYLDGQLVASDYASQTEAQMELDLVAWYGLFGDAPPSLDKPITDEALGFALAVFNRCFTVLTVQEKARTALHTIITPAIYTILADGGLSVLASSGRGKRTSYTVTTRKTLRDAVNDDAEATYQVTMACECRDFWVRPHAHGGVCKHVAARLLLFLAQLGVAYLKHLRDALDTHEHITGPAADIAPTSDSPMIALDDATDEDASAFLTIGASDLAAALFLASRAGLPAELRAELGALRLIADAVDLTVPGSDGDGSAAIRLEHAALAALYEQLRPIAKTAGTLHVFVEPSDRAIVLCGHGDDAFTATAHGEPIPLAPTPTGISTSEPTSASTLADATPVAEALYELFTLLERHEPEWYQRRHSRIAYEALMGVGRLISERPLT